jgi:uncharacterized protein (UPF0335 family)
MESEQKGKDTDTVVVSGGDTFPRPDPTKLTTDQLNQAISTSDRFNAMRIESVIQRLNTLADEIKSVYSECLEQTGMAVDHLRGFITARLDGMDKAITLLQDIFDRVPRLTDEKIAALRSLHEERLASIQVQFRERDVRTEQTSKDSKVAVDAALQAAKEAVGEQNKSSALAIAKSETSTTKQIDQLVAQIASQTKNFDDKIGDVKERLTRIEGGAVGHKDNESVHQSNNAFLFSAIASVVSIISLIVVIAMAIHAFGH